MDLFEEPLDVDELEELKLILDNNECPVVLIQEPRSHSRSELIKRLVANEYQVRACWFNCLEIFNFSQLFGTVLNKMFRPELDLDKLDVYKKEVLEDMCIDKNLNFITRVESKLKKIKHKNQIVVLENADQLAKSNKEFIEFLANINHLIRGLRFTTVLISNLKEDHFKKLGILFSEVYIIEFEPYTIEQIKSRIIDLRPQSFPERDYNGFVDYIIQTQSSICRDLNKLRYLCETFYRQYQSEAASGEQLQNKISFFAKQKSKMQSHLVYQTTNELNNKTEVPFCGKYLLVAAYLASYNSAATDKRFFSKLSDEKHGKRGRAASAFAKEDKQVAGPKKFTFERLYQIYCALLELNNANDKEMKTGSPTNQLFQQFQTFISAKMILVAESAASFSPYSSSAKYCISDFITEEFVKDLAKALNDLSGASEKGLDIDKFLEKNLMKA